ncbi:MAG TPA: PP2C family protein-serine/threonine phosphatase [Acidobacteriaceae bacterium]|nr:PP2C family protein-serine/threonine phosphatase [Acidobacteriaceae bacterium]
MKRRPRTLRKWCVLAQALVALACAPASQAAAQNPAKSPGSSGTPFVAQELGRATMALSGRWAFHPGDDMAWAAPGYDDSGWARIETGKTWEEQGFRNLTGFAWYRRKIVLNAGTNPDWTLALDLPAVENAAEVYWNGRLMGSSGKLPPDPVWYEALGVEFPCPTCGRGQIVLGRPESGVLAIRVWTAPHTFFSDPEVGGLTTTPEIGGAAAIRDLMGRHAARWLEGSLYGLGLALVEGLVALLALLAWLRDRKQWMLFWLALYTAHAVLLLPFNVPDLLSFRWSYGLIAPVVCLEDVSLWFLLLYLLNLRHDPRLVRWTIWMSAIAVLGDFGDGALQLFHWTTWPGHVFLGWDIGLTIPALLVEAWVLVLVVFAFRRRLDGARWLLAVAATLVDVIQAVSDWGGAGARWTHWTVAAVIGRPLFTLAGSAFTAGTLADSLLLVAIVYAVWRYQAEQGRKQSVLDEEFRNAQELQQVLVPEALPAVPGYRVSSAYRPAQVVGGDFFQILPARGGDAATLAVVGDVSGKGLKAAMTVALIVGALRTLAETTGDPAKLLEGLNRRLHGRLRGGFATCLAVRLQANGDCVAATAGHLPPLLNGEEVSLPGALPLGVVAETEYATTLIRMRAGDRLTLYTDGLPEARSAEGELFGFERVQALAVAEPDAERVAAAAARFGQEDDVTVVTVAREAQENVPAHRTAEAVPVQSTN